MLDPHSLPLPPPFYPRPAAQIIHEADHDRVSATVPQSMTWHQAHTPGNLTKRKRQESTSMDHVMAPSFHRPSTASSSSPDMTVANNLTSAAKDKSRTTQRVKMILDRIDSPNTESCINWVNPQPYPPVPASTGQAKGARCRSLTFKPRHVPAAQRAALEESPSSSIYASASVSPSSSSSYSWSRSTSKSPRSESIVSATSVSSGLSEQTTPVAKGIASTMLQSLLASGSHTSMSDLTASPTAVIFLSAPPPLPVIPPNDDAPLEPLLRSPPADRRRRSPSPLRGRMPGRVLLLREARFELEGRLLEMARHDRGPHVAVYDDTALHFAPQQSLERRWRPEGKMWIPKLNAGIANDMALPARGIPYRDEVETCLTKKGGRNVPLHIFHTDTIKEWGLRCPNPIPEATLVVLFTGEVIPSSLVKRREARGMGKYLIDLPGGDFAIDAWRRGGPARFLNHSSVPNLRWRVVDISRECCHVYGEGQGAPVLEEDEEQDAESASSKTNNGPLAKIGGATLQPALAFYSQRAIPAFEELTFDYWAQTEEGSSQSTAEIPWSKARHGPYPLES